MIKKISLLIGLSIFSFKEIYANQNDVNTIVSTSAQDTYQKINQNWQYVAADGILSTESTFWEAKWIQANANTNCERVATLILKTNPENIIEALVDLINNPAALECTTALTTAKLFCLKEIMGENKFKEYVCNFHHIINNTALSSIMSEEFFHELPLQFITTFKGNPIPGSIAYLTNVKDYPLYKPNGNSIGFNLFYLHSNLYFSFGQIFNKGPQSLENIEQYLFNQFCKKNDVQGLEEQHTIRCEFFNQNYQNFTQERRQLQQNTMFNFYQIFDETKVKEFTEKGTVEY